MRHAHAYLRVFVPFVLSFGSGWASAEPELKIPEVPDTQIANLVTVVAPSATCAAVDDRDGILAFGHKSGVTPHLSLFRLDAAGKPLAAPLQSLVLPRPATLGHLANYPLYLQFHPRLPLLYVWQDIEKPKGAMEPNPQDYLEFDHLLIYRFDGKELKLVQALGRGVELVTANKSGSIALNQAATRLYVPSIRPPAVKPAGYGGVGYYRLDANGMPVAEDKGKLYRFTPDNMAVFAGFPSGTGFVPVSDDVIIVGAAYGPLTWDLQNPNAQFNLIFTHVLIGVYSIDRIAGHPTLPVVIDCVMGTSWISRLEHAEGYLTLVPQLGLMEGATLNSYPVFMGRHNQVAVGGINKVHILLLDAEGRLTSRRIQAAVPNPSVEALAYSEKFDRLYAAVEKTK